jgi:hypothetical protein
MQCSQFISAHHQSCNSSSRPITPSMRALLNANKTSVPSRATVSHRSAGSITNRATEERLRNRHTASAPVICLPPARSLSSLLRRPAPTLLPVVPSHLPALHTNPTGARNCSKASTSRIDSVHDEAEQAASEETASQEACNLKNCEVDDSEHNDCDQAGSNTQQHLIDG